MTELETSTTELGKDQVKLTVVVPEKALEPAVAGVYRRWANEIRVPGFRQGKVPRKLIDTRVGPEVIREEALRDALPDLYRAALEAEELEAIAPPEIEVTKFEAGEPLVFEATVDLRPEITLPDLASIEVDAPPAEVTDEDIDEQLERLRDRFAELEPVSRPAQRGDHVLIDLKGYRHEELVEGASAPDYMYELGSGAGPAQLDEQLQGEKAGAILKFSDQIRLGDPNDEQSPTEINFTVLVKEVQAKKLPVLDDAFAKQVGEFDSMDALREDLRTKMAGYKASLVAEHVDSLALQAFVDASDLEPPEKLVESEFEHRLHHIEDDLQRAGMTLPEYAERSGTTELEVRNDLRQQAARSVKAELLLEEVAREADVQITQEDLGREVAYMAARTGEDPQKLAEQLTAQQRLGALAGDVLRRKALEHIVANIQIHGLPDPVEEGAAETSASEPETESDKSSDTTDGEGSD